MFGSPYTPGRAPRQPWLAMRVPCVGPTVLSSKAPCPAGLAKALEGQAQEEPRGPVTGDQPDLPPAQPPRPPDLTAPEEAPVCSVRRAIPRREQGCPRLLLPTPRHRRAAGSWEPAAPSFTKPLLHAVPSRAQHSPRAARRPPCHSSHTPAPSWATRQGGRRQPCWTSLTFTGCLHPPAGQGQLLRRPGTVLGHV